MSSLEIVNMRLFGLVLVILGVLALGISANAYSATVTHYNSFSPTNGTTYHPYYWMNYQAPPLPPVAPVYYYPSTITYNVKFHPFHQLTRAVRHVNRYFRSWDDD